MRRNLIFESKIPFLCFIRLPKYHKEVNTEAGKREGTLRQKPGFHMIVTVSDLLRHIGDVSPISQRQALKLISALSMRPLTVRV